MAGVEEADVDEGPHLLHWCLLHRLATPHAIEAGVEEAVVEEVPPVCLLHRLPHLHRQHRGRRRITSLELRLYPPLVECF